MKSFLFIFLCVLQQGFVFCEESRGLIVGGFPIAIEEVPYQVNLLLPSKTHICGGSIISKDWVLTVIILFYIEDPQTDVTINAYD